MGKIFRSRWAALFWAAGIVWTAYDVAEANAPSKHAAAQSNAQSTAADDITASDQDAALVSELINGN